MSLRSRLSSKDARRHPDHTPTPLRADADRGPLAFDWLRSVSQDLRSAIRMVRQGPGHSLIVVAILAVGIGGNAAVFSLFKAIALEPLPGVRDSADLVVAVTRTSSGRLAGFSSPDYRRLRDQATALSGAAASGMVPLILGRGADGERVWGEMVSGNYFDVLGVRAQLGRTLAARDDRAAGQHPVAVIADGLWRRAFAADPTVIGRTIWLNARAMTVVGVAEPGFQGTVVGLVMEVFVPMMMQPQFSPPDRLEHRASTMWMVLARLRPWASVASAAAEAQGLLAQADAVEPVPNVSQRGLVVPIWRSPYGAQTYMLPVVALLGVMGALLLLVVCANVANLVLGRGLARRGELAVRLAIGASRPRIVRLLVIESLVLAVPGAIAGVLLSRAALRLLATGASASAPMPIHFNTEPDGWVLGAVLLLSCASLLALGFVPALRTSNIDLSSVMKDGTRRANGPARLRRALVVAQVAVSFVLVVGAGLILRTLSEARAADVGFDASRVSTAAVELEQGGYDEKTSEVLLSRLVEAISAQPEVESVSLARSLPLTLVDGPVRRFTIEGYLPRTDEDMSFLFNVISAQYFKTLRIPLLAGREFNESDVTAGQGTAIVNETLARRMWETPQSALGRRIRASGGEWRTVVGVVRDMKYARIDEKPRPYVYLPFFQSYSPAFSILVRSSGVAADLRPILRRQLQGTDPNLPILDSRRLTEQTRAALFPYELAASSLAVFGSVTVVLSALGIYGLLSYSVGQKTHEIGVRLALGASRQEVVRRFLGHGLALAGVGTVLGAAVATLGGRLLQRFLYGVSGTDGVSFVAATAVVLMVSVVASLVPAMRASRVSPLTAFRHL